MKHKHNAGPSALVALGPIGLLFAAFFTGKLFINVLLFVFNMIEAGLNNAERKLKERK